MADQQKFLLATTSIKGGCGKSFFAKALVDYLRGGDSAPATVKSGGSAETASATPPLPTHKVDNIEDTKTDRDA